MHFFELKNIQHFVLYLFPAAVFVLIFGAALAHSHFHRKASEGETKKARHIFVEGIEERESPFPLVLMLIIVGTVIWAFLYTLGAGLLGVKI